MTARLRVVYLHDLEGWALHNVGLVLQEHLAPYGIDITCLTSEEWHRHPFQTDVLYLSYTGLAQDYGYRRYATTVISTVHDPCEISHFEDRNDWHRFPLRPVPFGQFDRVSAISDELVRLLATEYGVTAYRTPTWPLNGAELLARARPAHRTGAIRAFSSTNAPEFWPLGLLLYRLRTPGIYVRDQRGRLSMRQLSAMAILRRRKNIRLLRQIRGRFRAGAMVACDFRYGAVTPLPRDAYEARLAASDVYVCTSTMEGGPLPVLEAVFSGLAVISTPVGQVAEWVHHGENGFICSSFGEFVEALETYDRDRELLLRHRRRSVEIASAARFPIKAWLAFLTGEPPREP